jgi:nucleotide-binding universal stress UspA family protein
MEIGPAVVVGFDGSAGAARAVRFAAQDAALRQRPLRIVRVHNGSASEVARPLPAASAIGIARGYLDEDQILEAEAWGAPGEELIKAARDAELLVVGRGDVFRLGSALGSVALEVVAHAGCPIAIVGSADRSGADPDGAGAGVLAGIRRLDQADAILQVAFDEAERRRCGLEVVHAWRHPTPDRHFDMMFPVYDPVLYSEEQVERLADAVQNFADKYPDVPVTIAAPHTGAIDALLVAADSAALVVLGRPHRGPIKEFLLGSVGQTLLRQLTCPVIFLPDPPVN